MKQSKEYVNFQEKSKKEALKDHIKSLEILLERAKLRAFGTGKRNKEGFLDKGCRCKTCRARVERLETRLQEAKDKYEQE